MPFNPEILYTADGSPTLVHPELGETYHSTHGALTESQHIFIDAGLSACNKEEINIFEVGFGSGLNAYLTLKYLETCQNRIHYTTVEKYPVGMATILELPFSHDEKFINLHACQWNKDCAISERFTIKKLEADLGDTKYDTIFDLVYFDAFSPETQPEMWSEDIFKNLYDNMSEGAVLVTYCAKGVVKRRLRECGFHVTRLPGAPGKRHMVKAIKSAI